MGCLHVSWVWLGVGFSTAAVASAQTPPAAGTAAPPTAPGATTPASAAYPSASVPVAPPAPEVAPAPSAPASVQGQAPVPVYSPYTGPGYSPYAGAPMYPAGPGNPRMGGQGAYAGGESLLPEDAAVRSSPFLDATISLVSMENRFIDPLVFGIAFGAYLGRMVRVVGRLEMPSTTDDSESFDYDEDYPSGYGAVSPGAVTLIYGGSVGIVAAHSTAFVFSPGILFLRTDVAEYGNVLGISIPFEWTTTKGLRFGFEAGLGRAFGGTQRLTCAYATSCAEGGEIERDRDDARALVLRFELGFGFNHPRPTPTHSAQTRVLPPGPRF